MLHHPFLTGAITINQLYWWLLLRRQIKLTASWRKLAEKNGVQYLSLLHEKLTR